VLANGFVYRDWLFVSSRFCLGSALEAADLALDLGDILLRFENLAIDPVQFTQQFLSATIQVALHGGSPEVIERETASVDTSPRLIGHVQSQLQRSLDEMLFVPTDCMDSTSAYECRGHRLFCCRAALAVSCVFSKSNSMALTTSFPFAREKASPYADRFCPVSRSH
jgi:hypothetical protein